MSGCKNKCVHLKLCWSFSQSFTHVVIKCRAYTLLLYYSSVLITSNSVLLTEKKNCNSILIGINWYVYIDPSKSVKPAAGDNSCLQNRHHWSLWPVSPYNCYIFKIQLHRETWTLIQRCGRCSKYLGSIRWGVTFSLAKLEKMRWLLFNSNTVGHIHLRHRISHKLILHCWPFNMNRYTTPPLCVIWLIYYLMGEGRDWRGRGMQK